jgi:hypothetical protein
MRLDQRHVVNSTCERCESTRVARVEFGTLGEIQTPGLLIRIQARYPLRHKGVGLACWIRTSVPLVPNEVRQPLR